MPWLLLLLLLFGCGGGGGSSNVPTPIPPPSPQVIPTLDHYQPAFMAGQRLHGVVVYLNRQSEVATEWYAQPNSIRWGNSVEHMDVRECMGKRWSWLLSFEDTNLGTTYPLTNVRTTLDGLVLDCPQDGVPYQTYDLPAQGEQTVEQWGYVNGTLPFYWKATFIYGTVADNPCWQGDGPRTRPVIVQREIWWDANGGWNRGHPNVVGTLPWVNGKPVKIDVTYDWEVKNAQDAGILWRGGTDKDPMCMKDVTAW